MPVIGFLLSFSMHSELHSGLRHKLISSSEAPPTECWTSETKGRTLWLSSWYALRVFLAPKGQEEIVKPLHCNTARTFYHRQNEEWCITAARSVYNYQSQLSSSTLICGVPSMTAHVFFPRRLSSSAPSPAHSSALRISAATEHERNPSCVDILLFMRGSRFSS